MTPPPLFRKLIIQNFHSVETIRQLRQPKILHLAIGQLSETFMILYIPLIIMYREKYLYLSVMPMCIPFTKHRNMHHWGVHPAR